MSPQSFTFKLSVPADPDGAELVAAMAQHAAEYAGLEATTGTAFVARVRDAAAQAAKGAPKSHFQVVFAAANGQLTTTIGAQSISEPLPS